MNWLIDLGNTRLKCAPLTADGQRGPVQAFAHADDNEHLDALALILGPAKPGGRAWLASVAPAARTDAVSATLGRLGYGVERVRSRARCGRLAIAYALPEKLGVDRYLALLAASARDDGPWLIVSVGSALAVDLLGADGRHRGGLISATPAHLREALAARFPVLDLPAGRSDAGFASDTADAVATGARLAAVGLVERCLRDARSLLGAEPTLLVTGGGAASLGAVVASRRVDAPTLVLDGLARHVGAGLD